MISWFMRLSCEWCNSSRLRTYVRLIFQLFSVVPTISPQKSLCCSRVDDSRLWRGLEAYLVQLLEECRSVVYEHIHGLSEFPGARKLRSTFSAYVYVIDASSLELRPFQ